MRYVTDCEATIEGDIASVWQTNRICSIRAS